MTNCSILYASLVSLLKIQLKEVHIRNSTESTQEVIQYTLHISILREEYTEVRWDGVL